MFPIIDLGINSFQHILYISVVVSEGTSHLLCCQYCLLCMICSSLKLFFLLVQVVVVAPPPPSIYKCGNTTCANHAESNE